MRYEATYKDKLDRDFRSWHLGKRRDKEAALAALNEMPDIPGPFSFDEPRDKPVTQHYLLIEWDDGQQFALRKLHQLYLRN